MPQKKPDQMTDEELDTAISYLKKHKVYVIYALVDPRADGYGVFYVGLTTNPTQRLKQHCSERSKVMSWALKAMTVEIIQDAGAQPVMVILDEFDTDSKDTALDLETFWILEMKRRGCSLDNVIVSQERACGFERDPMEGIHAWHAIMEGTDIDDISDTLSNIPY